MAKSFFERITGSIKIHDEEMPTTDGTIETEETRPAIAKPAKQQRGRRPSFKAALAGVKEVVDEPAPGEEYENTPPPAIADEENSPVSFEEEKRMNPATDKESVPIIATSSQENEDGEEDEDGQLTVDIYDDGSHFVAQSAVAGVRPEDVEISVADNTLTIRGMRRRAPEVNHDRFYAQELYWGKFSRAVSLPEEVDDEKTEALLKNGLLTVRIAKKPRENTKKIRIKSE